MSLVAFVCAYCGANAQREAGAVNRARKAGMRLYCGRLCSGQAKRQGKTQKQKRAEKAVYDAEYRRKNAAKIKAEKAAYFRATYDPKAAREARKQRMPEHVRYCRRPEYRAKKKTYDQQRRAKLEYGEYWEAAIALARLENEVRARSDFVARATEKGTLNKVQTRRRTWRNLTRTT